MFTHVAEQLFHMKNLEAEKFNMLELMGNIPELQNLFRYSQKDQLYIKLIQQLKMSSPFQSTY